MSLPARFRWFTVCAMTAITILALPIPVRAVDRIVLHYPPFKDMAISVRDLEIFAKTGRVAPDFATYVRSVKPEQLQQLRQLLQQRVEVSPTYITQLTNSPLTQRSILSESSKTVIPIVGIASRNENRSICRYCFNVVPRSYHLAATCFKIPALKRSLRSIRSIVRFLGSRE